MKKSTHADMKNAAAWSSAESHFCNFTNHDDAAITNAEMAVAHCAQLAVEVSDDPVFDESLIEKIKAYIHRIDDHGDDAKVMTDAEWPAELIVSHVAAYVIAGAMLRVATEVFSDAARGRPWNQRAHGSPADIALDFMNDPKTRAALLERLTKAAKQMQEAKDKARRCV